MVEREENSLGKTLPGKTEFCSLWIIGPYNGARTNITHGVYLLSPPPFGGASYLEHINALFTNFRACPTALRAVVAGGAKTGLEHNDAPNGNN